MEYEIDNLFTSKFKRNVIYTTNSAFSGGSEAIKIMLVICLIEIKKKFKQLFHLFFPDNTQQGYNIFEENKSSQLIPVWWQSQWMSQ